MPLYRASLQTLGAIVLLALALACHGKNNGNGSTATISGTVTYLRVPLVKDAQGVPTGLADASNASNLQSLPAQGIVIRIYQQVAETNPDGSTKNAWILAQSSTTSSTGAYAATVPTGRATMVEVTSSFNGGSQGIQLIAESQGINSTTPVSDRMWYALRKAADGSSPAGTNANIPTSVLAGDSVVNFSVGLNDEWWIYNPSITSSTGVPPFIDQAVLETTVPGRTPGLGTGSRVLAIGDTIASFVTAYGTASPGTILYLHYWPGLDSGGSYVEYDRSRIALSLASSSYFGTLRGGPANDDAWDPGVILPMLARNVLYAANLVRTFSVPLNPLFPPGAPLSSLSADMARIEGLAQAMAANVLQSPYLADTQAPDASGKTLASLVDIRDTSSLSPAQLTPTTAPAIRAFAWEVILKANSLPTPGLPSDWATINALAAARFFMAPGFPTNGGTTATTTTHDFEPLNLYSQITRLKELKATTEPADLAAIFTDPVLTSVGAPLGITWPRPSTGPYASFVADWGTDPTGTLPVVVLSMGQATQVSVPNFTAPPLVSFSPAYPNVSAGEVFYGGFNLSADKRCTLSAAITPALGAGAQLVVDLPMMPRTFSFTGSGGTTDPIVLPVSNAVPYYHPIRLRMSSPAALQPDVTVTLSITPTP
jgi:hypothetical protein